MGLLTSEKKPSKTEERTIDMISQLIEAGDIQSERGKFSEASKFYARALKLSLKLKDYSSIDILFKTVQSCIDNRDYDTALKVMANVVKESDEFSLKSRPILKLMGMIHGAKGDLKNQVKCYNKIIKIRKSDPEGYCLAASALIKAGKKKKAEKYLDHAVKRIGSKDVEGYTGIARIYSDVGDHKKALELLERLKKDPVNESEFFWFELARAYYLSGSLTSAMEMADKARAIRDRFPEAVLLEGDIFRKRGEMVAARERYMEYLSIDKTNAEVYRKLESVSGNSGALKQMVAKDKYL